MHLGKLIFCLKSFDRVIDSTLVADLVWVDLSMLMLFEKAGGCHPSVVIAENEDQQKGRSVFKIEDKRARFGLEEFVLVTGLNAGDESNVDKILGVEGKITKGDVYNTFAFCKKRNNDKYKLGLIIILAYVWWATEENISIDLWWLDLVDDLNRFEKYPWGKISFDYTINVFNCEIGGKLKSSDVGGESCCRYSLHDFPLAIMIWAFEAIPTLGIKFATKYPDVIPRMVAWEMSKWLTSAAIDIVLKSKKELEAQLGFDDVRDVSAIERNVEVHEEDTKLEEEVRGKNVGGKDLEKEAGFGNDIDEQENEKLVEEGVGKEIILEEEHPNVEKCIADFVTPEKHDVDTNESRKVCKN
ncbi:Hypothetical predicted protein [Olea europaea subsp. europaea]|uniref:DUF1985 domain-containing protein n=1 Tax=Olea europaea subsp. europaea TaxID=158383 RepID=A0A8S0VBS3_OLEEU|nr:Hypothetical predicted protein [Olea europaea subsp. europaea]